MIVIMILFGRQVEELVRLSDCFLCYIPSPETGAVCPTPALSNGFITFGSFNNLAKVILSTCVAPVVFIIFNLLTLLFINHTTDNAQSIKSLGRDIMCSS